MYKKIKSWYDKGWWTAEQVQNAVKKGLLTEEQYNEIAEVTK